MSQEPKIYVAGHRGMVGSAIIRQLQSLPCGSGAAAANVITRTHAELDLTNQAAVQAFFAQEKPDQVYLAAAKVGGIHANNTYPAEFIYDNLMMQANVIDAAFKNGVKKLLFLGSSCIYPKLAEQPMREDALLTGTLESTNEPYAIAKIAGIKLCESYNRQYGESYGVDYRSVMPTNLYGPGDNYHPENSHVIPALIRRFHEAKVAQAPSVAIWGTGTPKREFLYVDDMAAASVHVNQTQFSANTEHPVFPELSALVRKTTGLRDVLALALAPLVSQIEVAFVFGSMAKATEGPHSDVDLLLIGDATFGQVANAVYDAQLVLAREINPKVMNRVEWSEKKNAQNVFVQELMDKPKIFVVGSEHEL